VSPIEGPPKKNSQGNVREQKIGNMHADGLMAAGRWGKDDHWAHRCNARGTDLIRVNVYDLINREGEEDIEHKNLVTPDDPATRVTVCTRC